MSDTSQARLPCEDFINLVDSDPNRATLFVSSILGETKYVYSLCSRSLLVHGTQCEGEGINKRKIARSQT